MALLIGDSTFASHTTSIPLTSSATTVVHTAGNDVQGLVAAEAGTPATLYISPSNWNAVGNIKFCLYEDNALVDSVIINSSVGTVTAGGEISVDITGWSAIPSSGPLYRPGIYLDTIGTVDWWAKTGALTNRRFAAGTYASPAATLPACSYVQLEELAWRIESADTPTASVDTIDNPVLDAETGNAATYSDFATASINAVTVDGIAGSSVADDDAGNVTWTNPSIMSIALAGGGAIPDFGTVAVEFTNGTETGSANTTFSEAAGFSTVTLAAIDTVSADYLYQLLLGVGITIANGEEIYYNNQSGQFTITADGGIVSTVSTSTLTNIKAGPVVTDMVTWTNGSVVTSNYSIFKSIYGSIYK